MGCLPTPAEQWGMAGVPCPTRQLHGRRLSGWKLQRVFLCVPKRRVGGLENDQLMVRCSSPAHGGSLYQLPAGDAAGCGRKAGRGQGRAAVDVREVTLRPRQPTRASPVCARSKAGRARRHPRVFKTLLHGTVSMARGKGDKSHLGRR